MITSGRVNHRGRRGHWVLRRLLSEDKGASAVEFALVLPVLVVLLLGTMYGASMYNTQQTITQAAREGARFGATLPLSAYGDADSPSPAWYSEVEGRALDVLRSDRPLSGGTPTVCIRVYTEVDGWHSSGDCAGLSTATDLPGPFVEVVVRREARLELGITSLPPITLSGSAVARYEPSIGSS